MSVCRAHTEEASNIFSKHPTGLQFPDDPQHFRVQVAFIVEAALPPCGGERLAREASEMRVTVRSPVFQRSLLCYGDVLKTGTSGDGLPAQRREMPPTRIDRQR